MQVPRGVYWKIPCLPPVESQLATLPSPAPMSDEMMAMWRSGTPWGAAFSAIGNAGKLRTRFVCASRIDDESSTRNSTSRSLVGGPAPAVPPWPPRPAAPPVPALPPAPAFPAPPPVPAPPPLPLPPALPPLPTRSRRAAGAHAPRAAARVSTGAGCAAAAARASRGAAGARAPRRAARAPAAAAGAAAAAAASRGAAGARAARRAARASRRYPRFPRRRHRCPRVPPPPPPAPPPTPPPARRSASGARRNADDGHDDRPSRPRMNHDPSASSLAYERRPASSRIVQQTVVV